eukprot:2441318-Rhodomonas_salina.1
MMTARSDLGTGSPAQSACVPSCPSLRPTMGGQRPWDTPPSTRGPTGKCPLLHGPPPCGDKGPGPPPWGLRCGLHGQRLPGLPVRSHVGCRQRACRQHVAGPRPGGQHIGELAPSPCLGSPGSCTRHPRPRVEPVQVRLVDVP